MEDAIERWLLANGIRYRRADDEAATRLDFFLPDFNVYIECKRFHTPRTNDQLKRAPNVIVVQGMECIGFLKMLTARPPRDPNSRPVLHLKNGAHA